MTQCEVCGKGPAAVFTPTLALCKRCRRELTRMEVEDNAIPNRPACATCSTLLNASGSCPECVLRSIRDGHQQMAKVS